MNKKDILNEMGGISPEFIEEANEPAKKKLPVTKLIAAVASFAIICAAVAVPLSMRDTPAVGTELAPSDTRPTFYTTEVAGGNYVPSETEVVKILEWDEMDDSLRFASIRDEAYRSFQGSGKPVDKSLLDGFLGNATAEGYDVYKDKTHTTKVAVYKMKNVATAVAVLVKYESLEDYYIFFNMEQPRYATLGEFVTAFDLSNNLSLAGTMYTTLHTESVSFTTREYTLTKATALRSLLLECTNAPFVEVDYITSLAPLHTVSFSIDCASTGQRNVSISVNECGYLFTNVGWVGRWYFIGRDQAAKIMDLAETTSVLVKEQTLVYERPDPSTEGPIFTSPAYDPNKPPKSTEVDSTTHGTIPVEFTTPVEYTTVALTTWDHATEAETTCETAKEPQTK